MAFLNSLGFVDRTESGETTVPVTNLNAPASIPGGGNIRVIYDDIHPVKVVGQWELVAKIH
jgi:hypothetical protein